MHFTSCFIDVYKMYEEIIRYVVKFLHFKFLHRDNKNEEATIYITLQIFIVHRKDLAISLTCFQTF